LVYVTNPLAKLLANPLATGTICMGDIVGMSFKTVIKLDEQ